VDFGLNLIIGTITWNMKNKQTQTLSENLIQKKLKFDQQTHLFKGPHRGKQGI